MSTKREYFLLGLPSLLQAIIAPFFDLGVDEAHYMLYAKHLDLSYFDHPPLVGWVHYIFNYFFGWNEFSARIPAILLGYLTTLLVYKFLRHRHFKPEESFWGALSINACFMLFACNIFLLPDTLILPITVAIIFTVEKIKTRRELKHWVVLGLLLGLAGLAKYTAILFAVALLTDIIVNRRFDLLRDRGLYLSIFVAAVLVSPVLIWNANNDWTSFRYQISHVTGGSANFKSFLESFAGQMGGYNPFLFPLGIAGFFVLLKNHQWRRTEFLIMIVFALFFIKSSFGNPILPHWTAPFFLLAVPLGVASLYKNWRRYIQRTILITFGFILFLSIEIFARFLPGLENAYRDIHGFPTIAGHLRELGNYPVGVTNWTYGSRMRFYNEDREVFVLDDRKDQFDLWEKSKPDGRDLLLVRFSFDHPDLLAYKCKDLTLIRTVDIISGRNKIYTAEFYLCQAFNTGI